MDKHIKINIQNVDDDSITSSVSIVGDEEFLIKALSSTMLRDDNFMLLMMKSVKAAISIKKIGKDLFIRSEEITPTIDTVVPLDELESEENIEESTKPEPFTGTVDDIKSEINNLFKNDDESRC